MQTNVYCCALALLTDGSGTGWMQCPGLYRGEGGGAAPRLLLEEGGQGITPTAGPVGRACAGWAEQLRAQQGCRAGQAGPPAHLPRCTGLAPSISLCCLPSGGGDTQCSVSSSLTRH